MTHIFLLLAVLTPTPEPTTKDAAAALKALDTIHAAQATIEKACARAVKARESMPESPLPHLSPEVNREIKRYRAEVSRMCPGA